MASCDQCPDVPLGASLKLTNPYIAFIECNLADGDYQ